MALEEVHVPPALDLIFHQVSQTLDPTQARYFIHEVKRLYPTKHEIFDQTDLYQVLKQLYILGAIDDGNQKLLEILAKKTWKKEDILKVISTGNKEASSPPNDDFVGRDADVSNIIQRVTNPRVPGINLFGDSGVGKTTLAKEVLKRMETFHKKVFIDVREISCLDNVYFNILQALHLPSWGDNKKERIYKHLEDFNTKTVLILDSVEQLLSKKNKEEQETRADFLEFLEVTITSEASKKGYLKVILTSTRQLNEAALKRKLFTEYNVQPFTNDVSKDFIGKRNKSDFSDVQQDTALVGVAELCRNNAYILQGAQQLMREGFATPTDVLRKITAQIAKGVPEEFACISAVFESLPSDHLRQIAVKISLLRRPFSVSTAMKITEIFSDYDAELDLELLAVHRIITAEDVDGKRKYDLHALFRDFVTSQLCKQDVYKTQLKRGEKLFFEHFSGKLTKLANNLESEFVKTYSELEGNKANFELAIHLSEENKETFDLLLHTDDHNQFALMGILFEVLKDVTERRELFGKWAKAAEEQGQWSISALMRCWQSIQGFDLEGTLNEEILEKAEISIQQLQSTSPDRETELKKINSLFSHCQGKIKWMKSKKLTPEQRTRNEGKKLLEEGIEHLLDSLGLRKSVALPNAEELNKQLKDSTLTARALNLIGNCYMYLQDPIKAEVFYQQALDMKMKLVGSEKHWEIPTYYNQMAQVHERLGHQEENKWYNWIFGLKGNARKEYEKAVEWMEKALALQEELGVNDTDHTAIFQRNLANILVKLGEYDKALKQAQKSCEIRKTNFGKHPETVRILYLIGIIHEWRKDLQAALQSYEEAFAMEKSLPEDNHSVVRQLLCDRLEKMRGRKRKREDKLEEYEPRATKIRKTDDIPSSSQSSSKDSPGPGEPFSAEVDDDNCDVSEISIDEMGGSLKISRNSVFLYFPPKALPKRTTVNYKVLPKDYSPSPAGTEETLVSNIVELGPDDVVIHQPIIVGLMHSGPGRDLGYETVVKAFNQNRGQWEELEELKDKSHLPKDYIQVQISKLTILAVVTRLITDRFHVTPKGCVIRSSVCYDVTVEFPEGAVDKTVEGTMKLLAISRNAFSETGIFLCPVLFVHGLKECKFKSPVTVRVPHPCPEQYSSQDKLILFCHKVDELKDLTKDVEPTLHESYIEFKVQHFCSFLVLLIKDPRRCMTEVMGTMYGVLRRLGTQLDLNNDQVGWVVVQISMHITLLPALRDYLKQEMEKHYNDLKAKHSIEKQSYKNHLLKDHGTQLNYKNINNNGIKKKKPHLYDYKVNSAVDLGRLYLKPYMVKFTGFDDNCDMSAVLGIMSSASVFSTNVKRLAGDLRDEVRNPGAHYNSKEWNENKIKKCFRLMKSLLEALNLLEDKERDMKDQLGKWESIKRLFSCSLQ